MNQPPDAPQPLLTRVAQGDPSAVKECIDRYGPMVWALGKRLSSDRSHIEDAVQEIFIDVWRSAHRFDPERASEATFIATIARRRVIDASRRSNRRATTELLDEEQFGQQDSGLERVDVCDEAEVAARALEKLQPDQRKVLTLSIREGLSHGQIAQKLELPLGTVKSHVRRGLERVAQLLKRTELGTAEEATS